LNLCANFPELGGIVAAPPQFGVRETGRQPASRRPVETPPSADAMGPSVEELAGPCRKFNQKMNGATRDPARINDIA